MVAGHGSRPQVLLEYDQHTPIRGLHGIMAIELASKWQEVLASTEELGSDGVLAEGASD